MLYILFAILDLVFLTPPPVCINWPFCVDGPFKTHQSIVDAANLQDKFGLRVGLLFTSITINNENAKYVV